MSDHDWIKKRIAELASQAGPKGPDEVLKRRSQTNDAARQLFPSLCSSWTGALRAMVDDLPQTASKSFAPVHGDQHFHADVAGNTLSIKLVLSEKDEPKMVVSTSFEPDDRDIYLALQSDGTVKGVIPAAPGRPRQDNIELERTPIDSFVTHVIKKALSKT